MPSWNIDSRDIQSSIRFNFCPVRVTFKSDLHSFNDDVVAKENILYNSGDTENELQQDLVPELSSDQLRIVVS